MEIDDPVAAWAWGEWAKDSIVDLVEERVERQRQRARRAYPPSPEEVAAAEYNARAAKVWSAAAAVYGVVMHGDGGGGPLLAPLTRCFVQLVGESLEGVPGLNDPKSQLKVLDAASGPGEPAASIAQRWPTLCAFSCDLAPGMTEEAQQQAWRQQHLPNMM
jgi:hypothetical protein